eukprot:216852-Amorphochlora_amoeboformis.AAC.2
MGGGREEYASRLMEKVVAKMCEDIGFDATRASTLDTLIDIGRRCENSLKFLLFTRVRWGPWTYFFQFKIHIT